MKNDINDVQKSIINSQVFHKRNIICLFNIENLSIKV